MEALIVIALIIVFLYDVGESAKKNALAEEKERRKREQEIKTQMQRKYAETYHPPDWETRRLYVLKRDGHRCTRCGETESLHVHHIIHRSEKIDHSESNLVTLCFSCHGSEHNRQFLDNESLRDRSRRKSLIEKAKLARRIKAKKLFRCEACSDWSAAGSVYAKVKTKNLVKRGGRAFYLEEKVCERCLLGESPPLIENVKSVFPAKTKINVAKNVNARISKEYSSSSGGQTIKLNTGVQEFSECKKWRYSKSTQTLISLASGACYGSGQFFIDESSDYRSLQGFCIKNADTPFVSYDDVDIVE